MQVNRMEEKNYDEMIELELLREIAKNGRKEAERARVMEIASMAFALAIIISLAILVPRTVSLVRNAGETMARAEKVAEDAEVVLAKANATLGEAKTAVEDADKAILDAQGSITKIDEMVGNVNGLVVDNTESVTETLKKVEEVDFEKLNQSIQDLHDILQPLANFIRRFQ